MSSTTNFQALLPYMFRPVYAFSNGAFTTNIVLSNIDKFYANTATFGALNIGDSSNNVYLGSNSGNSAAIVATCNASSNTSVGILSAQGLSISSNSEFIGYQCGGGGKGINNSLLGGVYAGSTGSNISNSILLGSFAGSNSSNINNSILIGNSNSSGLSTISNTIAIGGNAGSVGTSNLYIGTSAGSGVTGSCNLFIGHGLSAPTSSSNTLLVGSGATVLFTANFSNKSMSIGSGLTNTSNKLQLGGTGNVLFSGDFSNGAVTLGTVYPSSTPVSTINSSTWGGTINFPATSGYGFIALDVAGWTRISSGLTIATDPYNPIAGGKYELDVNGHFRVSDAYGGVSFSNSNGPISNVLLTVSNSSTSGNAAMTIGRSDGGTTSGTLNVYGPIVATSTIKATGFRSLNGTASLSPGAVLPITTISMGMILISAFDTATPANYSSGYFTVLANNTVSSNLTVNGTTVLCQISAGQLQISNTTGSGSTAAVNYNVTLFPN